VDGIMELDNSLVMKKCKSCKDKPAAINRLICNGCRKRRYNEMQSAKSVFKKKSKDIVDEEPKTSKREFWVDTPHRISRGWRPEDNFGNFY
tara:strand:+ start:29 stop:301 length:273 start_codon:yes stop_codon:yes gene_type:complete